MSHDKKSVENKFAFFGELYLFNRRVPGNWSRGREPGAKTRWDGQYFFARMGEINQAIIDS